MALKKNAKKATAQGSQTAPNGDISDEEILELEEKVGSVGGGPQRQAKNFASSAKRMLGLVAPHKFIMGLVLTLVAISVALNVYAPRVLGYAMDVIFDGAISSQLPEGVSKEDIVAGLRASGDDTFADMLSGMDVVPGAGVDFTRLGQLILLIIGLYMVASFFMWLQGFLLNRVVMRVVYNLRKEVEAKLNSLPLNYFDRGQRGDILSRTTNDVDNVQQALQQSMSQAINAVLTVIGIGIMMFSVSWQLALVALLAIPLTGAVIGIIGSRSQREFTTQWKSTGMLNGHIEETFAGHEVLQIFGRLDEAQRVFDERNEELYCSAQKAQFLSGMMMPIMNFISYLSYVVIAVLGGLKVAGGQLSLGDATAFIQYSRQFTQPLGQLGSMMQMIQSGVASAERVFELLDAKEEAGIKPLVTREVATAGLVEFKDVSFSYTEDEPLIHGLNLKVEPGQTAAIVGPTGAGKTTLVNLIMRFYDITDGSIAVDGQDIRNMPRSDLRERIGMVLQDAILFEGTIMENIRYGRLDATDEEVIQAAKAAYVDRFVHMLPDGYDTVITQETGSLSQGERQLVTIARAFLREPRILILDEATSSVDTRTEVLIQSAMNQLRENRTSFVIAHRLSTIRNADVILVMVDGNIVEQGSHDQLMGKKGHYYTLHQSQFEVQP